MPNDIWTPQTNWNAGTDFTEAKAEQEITDDMYVLSLAIDGDSSVSTIKHRHLAGINAARPVAGEAGRLYYATDDPRCVYLDNGAVWIIVGGETPRCHVYNSIALTINDATDTQLTFDSERYDNAGLHSIAALTSRITVPAGAAGLYGIGASIGWGASPTAGTVRRLALKLNGVTYLDIEEVPGIDSASKSNRQSIYIEHRLAVADYVEAEVYQNRGGTLSVVATGNFSPEFYVRHLGGA